MSDSSPLIHLNRLQRLDIALRSCYDARLGGIGDHRRHLDPWFACWYIRRGEVQLQWPGGGCGAGAGDWLLCPAGWQRTQRFSPEAHILSVRFALTWRGPPAWSSAGEAPVACADRTVSGLRPAAEALVAAAWSRPVAPGTSWPAEAALSLADYSRCRAALWDFFRQWVAARAVVGQPLQPLADPDPRLLPVIDRLRQPPWAGPVPYDDCCSLAGLSRAQLDRLLPRSLGTSPRRFRDGLCLTRAEAALAEGGISCKRLAAELGFADGSHFAKWFKRQTGQQPSAYRRGSV